MYLNEINRICELSGLKEFISPPAANDGPPSPFSHMFYWGGAFEVEIKFSPVTMNLKQTVYIAQAVANEDGDESENQQINKHIQKFYCNSNISSDLVVQTFVSWVDRNLGTEVTPS